MKFFNELSKKFQQGLKSAGDSINDQAWFQQLKSKWDELETQTQTLIKAVCFLAFVSTYLYFSFSFIGGAYALRNEYREKKELLHYLHVASQDIAQLGNQASAASAGKDARQILDELTSRAGLSPEAMNFSPPTPGNSTSFVEESLFDIDAKHVNLRQIMKYAYQIENHEVPIKLRNLQVRPTPGEDGPKGYLDAKFSVSVFKTKEEKRE